MKTDYEKMRERFLRRQNMGEGGDKRFLSLKKPEAGKGYRYRIRILPPAKGYDSWDFEFGQHYNVLEGGGALMCPKKTKGEPCPICEFVKPLWDGDESDKNMARGMNAKTRYLANVIDMRDPSTVKLWEFGPQVWDQITAIIFGAEDGIVPIDDPEKGHTLQVVIKTEKSGEKVYPKYIVTPEIKPSALPDMSVLDALHDPEAVKLPDLKSYKELEAILKGPDESGETVEAEPEQADEAAGDDGGEEIVDDDPGEDQTKVPPVDDGGEEVVDDPEVVEIEEPEPEPKKNATAKKENKSNGAKANGGKSAVQIAKERLAKKRAGK